MCYFSEKVAAAKSAPRSFRDVTVSLDAGVGAERDRLNVERAALLNPTDKRLSRKPDTSEIDAQLADLEKREGDTLITLRFYKVPGDEWANLTATHPAREGAAIDSKYHYNMHGVCKASAVAHGRTIDGETEEAHTAEEWAELWTLLAGVEFAAVCDAIYYLNEYEPMERVERLKNSSEAATASDKR